MTRNELCFRLKLICISPTVSPGIRRFSWQFTDCERVSLSRCITSREVCKGVYHSASNLCLWATGLILFWFRCLGCLLLSIWTIEVPRICGEDCRVSLVMLYSRELITVLVWHSRVGPTVRRSGLYTYTLLRMMVSNFSFRRSSRTYLDWLLATREKWQLELQHTPCPASVCHVAACYPSLSAKTYTLWYPSRAKY